MYYSLKVEIETALYRESFVIYRFPLRQILLYC